MSDGVFDCEDKNEDEDRYYLVMFHGQKYLGFIVRAAAGGWLRKLEDDERTEIYHEDLRQFIQENWVEEQEALEAWWLASLCDDQVRRNDFFAQLQQQGRNLIDAGRVLQVGDASPLFFAENEIPQGHMVLGSEERDVFIWYEGDELRLIGDFASVKLAIDNAFPSRPPPPR